MSERVDLPLSHRFVEPRSGADGPAPVVVVLHGRGADETDLLSVAQRLPDELAVLSLRAPQPLGPGYTWYDLDLSAGGLHESQPDPEGFRRSLDLVTESIDAAVESFELDPDRVGLLGFSQGAITALSLVLEAPDRYAWCVALHGYLPESHADLDPEGIEGKPIFVGAGESDQVIPPERSERAASRMEELGCSVTYEAYPGGHGIGSAELSDLVAWVERRVDRRASKG